jgi:hypothetical protein
MKTQAYIEEGLRRMKIRKAKRKEKRARNKSSRFWTRTWEEGGKTMQNCDYYGTCEFPCNGDC